MIIRCECLKEISKLRKVSKLARFLHSDLSVFRAVWEHEPLHGCFDRWISCTYPAACFWKRQIATTGSVLQIITETNVARNVH